MGTFAQIQVKVLSTPKCIGISNISKTTPLFMYILCVIMLHTLCQTESRNFLVHLQGHFFTQYVVYEIYEIMFVVLSTFMFKGEGIWTTKLCDNTVLFITRDIARRLGFQNSNQAIITHVGRELVVRILEPSVVALQSLNIIARSTIKQFLIIPIDLVFLGMYKVNSTLNIS